MLIDQTKVRVDFIDGVGHITITEGEFKDVTFSYGKVEFPETEDPTISYQYELHSDPPKELRVFEEAIGELLIKMIKEQLADNSVIYSGGK